MGKSTDRPGAVHRVYLSPEREGALQAYLEDREKAVGKLPAVNSVLLDLLVGMLENEGYLPRGTMEPKRRHVNRSPRNHDRKEQQHDTSD